MMIQKRLLWIFLVFTSLLIISCNEETSAPEEKPFLNAAKEYNNDVVFQWSELYLSIERYIQAFRPAATSRAMAYINMAAYETALPGMPDFVSNSKKLPNLNVPTINKTVDQYHWNIALNAAYKKMFHHFIIKMESSHKEQIESLYTAIDNELNDQVSSEIYNNSLAWGNSIADAIIAYADTDQAAVDHLAKGAYHPDYSPVTGPGKWVKTSPDFSRALFPYWGGKVRNFVSKDVEILSPDVYAPYSTTPGSRYYNMHKELYEKAEVTKITNSNRWIAEFWSDDIVGLTFSPPARVLAIANQLVKLENNNLEEVVHLYCKLGIAMNDAADLAWKGKYLYNTERPETYVQQFIDPNFEPILGEAVGVKGMTPPFPAYPSGHSTFGGIMLVFKEFYGRNYTFTDNCHKDRVEFIGTPKTFVSWEDMGWEDAISRVPLGVHVIMDCQEGFRLGKEIAKRVEKYNLKR